MAGEVTKEQDFNTGGGTATPSTGGTFMDSLRKAWNNPQQRILLIGGAALLVIFLFMGFSLFNKKSDENRGKLVPLVQELDQARAFEIVAKLKSVNIEAKVLSSEKPGEYIVMVYEQAVETSYLTLSRTNLLEDEGYGLFDESDWAASDYDKRIKLTRAINGDLSRIISRMDGVHAATVRVNVPEQQLFTELQSPTTATVQIELANDGEELTKSQVKSIVNMLRGYVPNLQPDKISIVDTQGRNYNAFKDEDEGDTEEFIDELEKINKTIEKRIQKYLDSVLGPDLYKVSASASISREKIEKQATKYSEGAIGSRQLGTEVLNAEGAVSRAGPGIGGGGKNYHHDSSSETMFPSFEQQNVTYLPGRVTDVTVALAIDKSVPAMLSLEQLRESVAAIVGPNVKAENIKLTVIDLQAGTTETPQISKPGLIQYVSNFFKGGIWSVVVKIFSIIGIILGLLVVAIIGLNFLNAAASANVKTSVDSNLGSEFDQVLGDTNPSYDDFGEQKALEQQEALLKEMMNQAQPSSPSAKAEATSYSAPSAESREFESLLNNFQSVASSKPDLLAKKIQVWLEEE
jgi:flagellar M-ring protein FliF